MSYHLVVKMVMENQYPVLIGLAIYLNYILLLNITMMVFNVY